MNHEHVLVPLIRYVFLGLNTRGFSARIQAPTKQFSIAEFLYFSQKTASCSKVITGTLENGVK